MKTNISKPLPSQDELHSLFAYDPVKGQLIWRARPLRDFATERGWRVFNARDVGRAAGYLRPDGYVIVRINGINLMAHRLIWTLHYGAIQSGLQIDHINGMRSDNRIENLQLVTNMENQRNQKRRSTNTSGVTGVSWRSDRGRWRARATINGKRQILGYFDILDEAAAAVATFYRANGFSERHIGQD